MKPGSDKLTAPNPELARQQRITVQGMAHWSGTGPAKTTCGGCHFWGFDRHDHFDSHRCGKYHRMTSARGAERIELHQPSCRHYQEATPEREALRIKLSASK